MPLSLRERFRRYTNRKSARALARPVSTPLKLPPVAEPSSCEVDTTPKDGGGVRVPDTVVQGGRLQQRGSPEVHGSTATDAAIPLQSLQDQTAEEQRILNNQTAILERAVEEYLSSIASENQNASLAREALIGTTFEDLISHVRTLQEDYGEQSFCKRLVDKLEPGLQKILRFSKVIEVMIQSKPELAALIWGGLKLLLQVSRSTLIVSLNYNEPYCLSRLRANSKASLKNW